jgi:hypothetical protein
VSSDDKNGGRNANRSDRSDGGWDERLTEAARAYHEPPATPSERMWERIDAARRPAAGGDGRPRSRRPWWHRRERLWPAAAAAALVIGLLIGRWWPRTPVADVQLAGPTTAVERATEPTSPSFSLAARPLIGRAETLFLQYRTMPADAAEPHHFSGRAATLLNQTRFLLASPAANEPELRSLLEDLELALARVVLLAVEQRAEERATLSDALDRQAILPRLQARLHTDDELPRL